MAEASFERRSRLSSRTIALRQVPTLVFGSGSLALCREHLRTTGASRILAITSPSNRATAETLLNGFAHSVIDDRICSEPTVAMFQQTLARARTAAPDLIVGIGGGSPLDVAKLVAALTASTQTIDEAFGIGNLAARSLPLVCIPTTAGTGSEVSPNAILLDEPKQMKKGVISPYLVPDATFIDPELMRSVPAHVTAATGLDALTHCIEAYANNFAHPMVDTWALDGIRKIANSLVTAVREPNNLNAREQVALGSLYGGLCLGPVNTAAVHALSYPLGSRYHVPHGHANAILMPHVCRFNMVAAPHRYRDIALALGARNEGSAEATSLVGIDRLWRLIRDTGLEMNLARLDIPASDIPSMAEAGLNVTRLMKNNLRLMTQQDAEAIYSAAFSS
jgi:alcohol dehydrogenase class IV